MALSGTDPTANLSAGKGSVSCKQGLPVVCQCYQLISLGALLSPLCASIRRLEGTLDDNCQWSESCG